MTADILTNAVALVSFGLFMLTHVIICRRMSAEDLLKTLWASCASTMVLPVVLMGILYISGLLQLATEAWLCAAVLATLVHGIMCFVYVLCVFGPYETSVRMRLVREIGNAPSKGMPMAILNQRYNNETIVNIRLRRLLGSKYIKEHNGSYTAGVANNVFFVFDIVVKFLVKMIGPK